MKVFLLIFVLIAQRNTLMAQKSVARDSGVVTVRSIPQEAIRRFSEDSDFQYENYKEPPQSLWSKFWDYIWYQIEKLMSTQPGRITVWAVIILVALGIIGFFIAKVMGMKRASLFSRTSTETLPYTVSSDDIHGISFDEAIKNAVGKGDYRLAIRLLYLQSLRILSDKEYIDWRINKTNTEYILEVINRPWYSLFRFLTIRFEYAWYGEVKINLDDFERLQVQFQQFNNQLQ